ncbi:unnamed protein product [Allacma fusca]|uniref:SAM-dependent MTase RsmB/NOP-type domain-containing protein n=1 Tax=Allacma fusca TaxID=39272 RepID=A0A8J2KFH3_9HEXA|nr:unnamed protein product [Allacma fusca]
MGNKLNWLNQVKNMFIEANLKDEFENLSCNYINDNFNTVVAKYAQWLVNEDVKNMHANQHLQQLSIIKTHKLEFDRILWDVPYSGDDTIPKNIVAWEKWFVYGLTLHNMQVQILRRGLELITFVGHMKYSTSSLNTIVNEAGIHSVLKESKA